MLARVWRECGANMAGDRPAPYTHLDRRGAARLKGVDNTAQGNALRIAASPAQALKGRHRRPRPNGNTPQEPATEVAKMSLSRPFRAWLTVGAYSQGVALGFIMSAFQAVARQPPRGV